MLASYLVQLYIYKSMSRDGILKYDELIRLVHHGIAVRELVCITITP